MRRVLLLIMVYGFTTLLIGCSGSASDPVEIADQFLRAKTYEERYELSLDASSYEEYVNENNATDSMREELAKNYIENIDKGFISLELINEDNQGWTQVGVRNKGSIEYDNIINMKNKRGFKIHATSSFGINNPGLIELKYTRPNEKQTIMIYAELNDYYNYDFSGAENTHYSISLNDSISNEYIHGYVEKNSDLGEKLFNLLKDGKEHRVTLEIYFNPNLSPESNMVNITKLISDGWIPVD